MFLFTVLTVDDSPQCSELSAQRSVADSVNNQQSSDVRGTASTAVSWLLLLRSPPELLGPTWEFLLGRPPEIDARHIFGFSKTVSLSRWASRWSSNGPVMSTRGADKAQRAARGPPSERTISKRAQKKADASRRADQQGFSQLFGGASSAAAASSRGAEAAGAPAGAEQGENVRESSAPDNGAPSEGPRANEAPRPEAARQRRSSAPHSADMGLDADSDSEGDESDPGEDEPEPPAAGRQQLYAAIYSRLQVELAKKGPATDKWLIKHLKANGWWLRAGCVALVAGALVLRKGTRSAQYRVIDEPDAQADIFYERDLQVCMPDAMWGMSIACPSCGEADQTKVHGYSEQPARRVQDFFKDFDVMGRRHCCNRCHQVRTGQGEGRGDAWSANALVERPPRPRPSCAEGERGQGGSRRRARARGRARGGEERAQEGRRRRSIHLHVDQLDGARQS